MNTENGRAGNRPSRRRLLRFAGGAGLAAAAVAAEQLAKPIPASASSSSNPTMVIGGDYRTTLITQITNTKGDSGVAFAGLGAKASGGLFGQTGTGSGVFGNATGAGSGVNGQ